MNSLKADIDPMHHSHFHLPVLEGLRGMACLCVVYNHLLWIHTTGALGVMMFFVMSGFLMAMLYLPITPGRFTSRYWTIFLTRRFFRVYPLYAILTLATWEAAKIYPFVWPGELQPQLLIDRILLIDGNAFWWTIPVEMRFYLLFPLIAIAVCAAIPRKSGGRMLALVAIWLASLLASWKYTLTPGISPPWTIANFFTGTSMYFIGGVALGYAYKLYPETLSKLSPLWTGLAILCLVIFACFSTHPTIDFFGLTDFLWDKPVWPFLLSAGMVFSGLLSHRIVTCLFTNPVTQFFGKISYSLFLFHPIVRNSLSHLTVFATLLAPLKEDFLALIVKGMLVLVLATGCSAILYYLIERPGIMLGKHIIKHYIER